MNKFRILMIASEAYPFAKSGGLADVVSSLSKSLLLKGHDVRIIIPRYYSIDPKNLDVLVESLCINMDYGEEWVKIYQSKIPNSNVTIYFIENHDLFGRNGFYGPSPEYEYNDNSRRFSVFCKVALEFCKEIKWVPNIMHCHDWQSSLIPSLLYNKDIDPIFNKTASIITIHNLGYQGCFPLEDMNFTGLDQSSNTFNDGIFNFLRIGISKADIITTVSPTYAMEIRTKEYGNNLEYILNRREGDLFGILNGCDYDEWDPATDKCLIPYNYSISDLKNKGKLKETIQKDAGFELDSSIPLFSNITRLVDQKGIGALCGPNYGSLYRLCAELKIQIIIVGTGESWCEEELSTLDKKLNNFKFIKAFDNDLSHKIEAASDFFIMPSKYEPCGLNQIYSLKYGTIPIVRNTGGLADTVDCYDNETGTGTGFTFNDLTPEAIYNTVAWATWVWYNKKEDIIRIQQQGMKKDFSWEKSSEKYSEIYQWALDRKENRYPRSW